MAITSLKAVPAYPFPIEYKQPNGEIITILMKGDEKVKWAQTPDGYTILSKNDGYYEYAMKDSNGDLIHSGVVVSSQGKRSTSENDFLNKIEKGLFYSKSQLNVIDQIWEIKDKSAKAFPTTGNRKLVCILIGFTDKAFTKTQAEFNNLFNQVGYTTGGATGSVKDFYTENSWGQFNLTVDVFGPYTASQNMAYYGANDASGNDVRPRELVTEAINLADPTANFANYDNDGDGSVDGVYIVYAGYGEEAGGGANCIWAHAWNITTITRDGKTLSKYSCSAELRGSSGTTITAIGVICHEFGHVLGAPDYYDTNYSTGGQYSGTSTWDMMASGSWNNNGVTPAHHNAFTKIYFYNWATATTLSTAQAVSVSNAAENKSFYRINTATTGEYYLIENREKHMFDAYIPGSGLIIYHVHSGVMTSASSNTINATHQQRMYPVAQNATVGKPTSTASTYGTVDVASCAWTGATGTKTEFSDTSIPNMKSWAGANTGMPITNISRNATTKVVTFDFMGGGSTIVVPTVSTTAASSITTNSAVSGGNVTADGGATVTARGVCYSTSQNPTTANATVASGSGTGSFTANITGLAANTTYYVRAYATNSAGTAYGSQISFTTLANPTSLTLPVTENFNASTLPSGWATQNVGTGITERWSISNSANAGGSAFEARCTYQNLNPGTTRLITPAVNTVGVSQVTFSFRHMLDAYGTGVTLRVQTSNDKSTWTNTSWSVATTSTNIAAAVVNVTVTTNLNSANTFFALVAEGNLYQIDYWYVDNISITGVTPTPPTVTTTSVSSITANSAVSGGNVTSEGSATVTERGICFSTSQNPTTANSKVVSGSGTGSFTANMTGLTANTTYYVRAYAINSAGTSYGSQVSFTTLTASGGLPLPVSQTFSASTMPTGWTTQNVGTGITERWSISNTANAGGSAFEARCTYQNVNPGTTRLITPAVNTVGVSQVTFSFRHMLDAYGTGVTLRVQTSTDRTTWTNTSWAVSTTSTNIAAVTVNVTITTSLNSPNTYFAFVAEGNLYQIDYWYIDNVSIIASGSLAPPTNEVDQVNNEFQFTLYPNPVNDLLTLNYGTDVQQLTGRIFDLQGRMVKQFILNNTESEVDVTDLAKGVYIISVNYGEKLHSKRFIKM